MRITICGGNGFLGQALARFFLDNKDIVVVLSRSTSVVKGVKHVFWGNLADVKRAIETADVVINLAGRSVDCRYNQKNKEQILQSRIETTRQIGEAMAGLENKPKVWLNASTATIYRHATDRPMTEEHGEIGSDFSMDVAKAWEHEFFRHQCSGVRQVALRTSNVFGKGGGAYIPLKILVKAGLGGKISNGQQMVSWIHVADFCRAVSWISARDTISGPINVTAPNPLNNKEQMAILRKYLNLKICLSTPEWLLHIGAWLIRTEPELVLKSRWVLPEKLAKSGFTWRFNQFSEAVADLAMNHSKS